MSDTDVLPTPATDADDWHVLDADAVGRLATAPARGLTTTAALLSKYGPKTGRQEAKHSHPPTTGANQQHKAEALGALTGWTRADTRSLHAIIDEAG